MLQVTSRRMVAQAGWRMGVSNRRYAWLLAGATVGPVGGLFWQVEEQGGHET